MSDPGTNNSRLTLVTALYDLVRREPGSTRRTVDDYLRLGEFVFGLDCDVVFYVDPELEGEVRARRAARDLAERTLVIPAALESLDTHGSLSAICAARERHPLINGNPVKDTPLYTVLGQSKFELLQRTIEARPFPATHVGWIDLGLAHVARTGHVIEDGVFTRPGAGVRALMMRSPRADELADRGHYLSYRWGHFAGGYLCGEPEAVADLSRLVREEAAAALEDGYAAIDEQLLGLAYSRGFPFTLHYGDYSHILENCRRARGSADNLLFQLRHCRGAGAWDRSRAREIATGIVSGCGEGVFQCDPRLLPELLEECALSIYFADFPRVEEASKVVSLYHRLAREDATFREAFLRNEIRVRTNFAALSDSLPC